MAHMYYFCSPQATLKYCGRHRSRNSPANATRYKRSCRKTCCLRSLNRMDHACMARFIEPACSASSFEILSNLPSQAALHDSLDSLDRCNSTQAGSTPEETSNGACEDTRIKLEFGDINHSSYGAFTSQDVPKLDSDPTSCTRHPEPQSDDSLLGEDERRRRLTIDGIRTEGLRQFGMRSDPLVQPKTASHHPSCDNLRALACPTDTLYTPQSLTSTSANQQDSLPARPGVQYGEAAQYTVLSDMAETAWSVDDPRYSADVLESLSVWNASKPMLRLGDTLAKRCVADESSVPFLSRWDMIDSGVDMQGIDWRCLDVSKQEVLHHRALHSSTINLDRDDGELCLPDMSSQDERHYRFHSYNGLIRPKFEHHQLRHVLASDGRDMYYTSSGKIMRTALSCAGSEDTVLDLSKSRMTSKPIRITCLSTTDSLIVAGGFDGEYAISNLDFTSSHSEGYVTHNHDGLVTHIHTFPHRRSGLPQAAFCANDQRLRLMDLTTQTFTKTLSYENSLNAAATASDGRLRALMGDSPTALITDAETGETLAGLQSHTDHIFACAWSQDDRLLATGAQDGKIALWDSRYWTKPVAELPNARSCSRSLQFTADSSVLVSAENEDVVSIFDTRDLAAGRQDVCFLGTIAGVTMVDGGDEIVVANGDKSVGGLLSFRRVSGGREGRARLRGGNGQRRTGRSDMFCDDEYLV